MELESSSKVHALTPLTSSHINLGINKLCLIHTGQIDRVKPRSVLDRVTNGQSVNVSTSPIALLMA